MPCQRKPESCSRSVLSAASETMPTRSVSSSTPTSSVTYTTQRLPTCAATAAPEDGSAISQDPAADLSSTSASTSSTSSDTSRDSRIRYPHTVRPTITSVPTAPTAETRAGQSKPRATPTPSRTSRPHSSNSTTVLPSRSKPASIST